MSIKGFEVGGVQQQYDYTALDNIPANLVQDANYVHTDNNYTNADKTKLSGIEAQANKTTIDATLTHSGQAADAKATGDAISALNAQVIASMPHDTASGSIASFPDGAAMPVIDCSVAVATNQNLHGYDNPWPAGGGKNLCPPFVPTSGTGLTVTANSDGSLSVSGTATASGYITEFATLSQTIPSGTEVVISIKNAVTARIRAFFDDGVADIYAGSTSSASITQSVDITKVRLYLFLTTGTAYNFTIYFQLEKGSTATSYAPYSNICPISGWTECKVTRTGINVWDEETESGRISASGQPSVDASYMRTKNFISIKPNTAYYRKSPNIIQLFWYDAGQNFLSYANWGTGAITSPSNAYYVKFHIDPAYGTTYNHNISINYPSTDTEYHEGQVSTYTIDLNGTRYGGTLDVTSGKLTVTMVKANLYGSGITVSRATTQISGKYRFQIQGITGMAEPSSTAVATTAICNRYPPKSADSLYSASSSGFAIRNSYIVHVYDETHSADTAEDFKSYLQTNDVYIVYPLATPIEVDLTPTEVSTLLGTNNIFADCGDTTVDYYADTTLFVNKKIAAAVAALS